MDKFEDFRNNVFCRRDDNQHKARILWEDISKLISNEDKIKFQTEWSHYMMGDMELDVDGFSLFFDSYIKKYIK